MNNIGINLLKNFNKNFIQVGLSNFESSGNFKTFIGRNWKKSKRIGIPSIKEVRLNRNSKRVEGTNSDCIQK